MRGLRTSLLTTFMLTGAAAPAWAAPLSAGTILQDFNEAVFHDAITTADVAGAGVVGGNDLDATVNDRPLAATLSGFGALTVRGNTGGNPININSGGVYVGGNHGTTINFNGGGYVAAPAYGIADFETPLLALSNPLSQLTATSALPAAGNNEVLRAIPGAPGVAVSDIAAAQLSAIPGFQVNLNGAGSVVFNVSGDAAFFSANGESGMTGASDIIWSLLDANSVAISTMIGRTVLAPQAAASSSNQIDGVLVAKSWTGTGELHDWQYGGALSTAAAPAAVPEPPTLFVLASGLLTLAAMLGTQRRRLMRRRIR